MAGYRGSRDQVAATELMPEVRAVPSPQSGTGPENGESTGSGVVGGSSNLADSVIQLSMEIATHVLDNSHPSPSSSNSIHRESGSRPSGLRPRPHTNGSALWL